MKKESLRLSYFIFALECLGSPLQKNRSGTQNIVILISLKFDRFGIKYFLEEKKLVTTLPKFWNISLFPSQKLPLYFEYISAFCLIINNIGELQLYIEIIE